MAKLTKKDVLHVAKLANLKLTEKEVKKFTTQLSAIVEYIDELSKVGTKGLKETSQTTGLENVSRKDEIDVNVQLSQEEATQEAKSLHNGYFQTERVIDSEQ